MIVVDLSLPYSDGVLIANAPMSDFRNNLGTLLQLAGLTFLPVLIIWQLNYGSPGGTPHAAAALHQVEIDRQQIGGVGVDINNILKPQYGQWD